MGQNAAHPRVPAGGPGPRLEPHLHQAQGLGNHRVGLGSRQQLGQDGESNDYPAPYTSEYFCVCVGGGGGGRVGRMGAECLSDIKSAW